MHALFFRRTTPQVPVWQAGFVGKPQGLTPFFVAWQNVNLRRVVIMSRPVFRVPKTSHTNRMRCNGMRGPVRARTPRSTT
jgi:hypothetical protein